MKIKRSSLQFRKPPISKGEKLKLTEEFIKAADYPATDIANFNKASKAKLHSLHIRIPDTLKNDIETIHNMTGLTLNAICVQVLLPGIKKALKRLADGEEEKE